MVAFYGKCPLRGIGEGPGAGKCKLPSRPSRVPAEPRAGRAIYSLILPYTLLYPLILRPYTLLYSLIPRGARGAARAARRARLGAHGSADNNAVATPHSVGRSCSAHATMLRNTKGAAMTLRVQIWGGSRSRSRSHRQVGRGSWRAPRTPNFSAD